MNTKKKVRIVVIDSGIDKNKYNLQEFVKKSIGLRIDSCGKIKFTNDPIIENKHGTLIAACIKHINNNVEFIDINILDSDLSCNGDLLIEALKYSKEFKPNIINLSLGTTSKFYGLKMRKIIKQIIKKGTIVISACENNNKICYPAFLKGVIAVKGNENCSLYNYKYSEKFYYTYNRLPRTLCLNDNDKKFIGNSIACSYITGQLSEKYI